MLSNPAVGNGSQKFKRKLTNKHVKGHTNTGAGQGTHCPGLKTPKPGNQKHQHRSWARKTPIQELKTPREGNTLIWELKTPNPAPSTRGILQDLQDLAMYHVDHKHSASNSFRALVGLPSSTHSSSIIDGRPRDMKTLEDADGRNSFQLQCFNFH